jgi:hypothetical protein
MRRADTVKVGVVAAVMAAVAMGCAAGQAGKAKPSGFLGDYSQFRKGQKGEALMVYVAPQARFAHYRKILVDPITIWRSTETNTIPAVEAANLMDDLDDLLRLTLDDDYEIVETAGPDVLRLRVALTEAEGSWRVLGQLSDELDDDLQAVLPDQPSSATRGFVGKAGVEAELLDSMTSTRLAAAVDRRVGEKTLKPEANRWDDVEDAFRYWAERLRDRLRELRKRG